MKIPKTFIPEKDLDKNTEELLIGKPKPYPSYSDKAIFEGLSFQQLEELVSLEDKIDHLKIGFEDRGYKYQLVYTPGTKSLQLLQEPPSLSSFTAQNLTKKVKSFFSLFADHSVTDLDSVEYVSSTGCYLADIPLKSLFSVKELKRFFDGRTLTTKYSSDRFEFKNVSIYIEYDDLKKEDMRYVGLIPEEQRLYKSKTYET